MKIEIKEMVVIKEALQILMKHLLDLLREILATVHEERILIQYNEISKIKEVLTRREELLQGFDLYYKDFVCNLQLMRDDFLNEFSLIEGLEWLHMHLDAEDVELLLLCGQLSRVGKEMQTETKTLIGLLEHKSALESSLSSYLIKIAPKPIRAAIGFADDDEPESKNSPTF